MLKCQYCKAVTGLVIALLTSLGRANSYVTWAWTQSIGVPGLTVLIAEAALDDAGRSYALYRISSGSPGVTISLRGFAPTGAPIFAKTVLSTSTDAVAGHLHVSNVSGTQYVYVSAKYRVATSWYAHYSKYDTSGTLLWSHVVSASGGTAVPLAVDTDSVGNAYIATAVIAGGVWKTDLQELDAAGTVLHHFTETRIAPDPVNPQAHFQAGVWLVSGTDNAFANSPVWAAYSATTGATIGIHDFADKTAGGFRYHYTVTAYPYFGNVLQMLSRQSVPVGGGSTSYQHQVSSESYVGAVSWSTPYVGSAVSQAYTGLPSDPVYILGRSHDGPFIQQISNAGAVQWTILISGQFPAISLKADSGGFFLGSWTASQTLIYRYDTLGHVLWSYNASTGGQVTSLCEQNGVVLMSYLQNTSGAQQGAFDRYVTGLALDHLTPAASSVSGGGTDVVTTYLNGSASNDTSIQLHSASPSLVFDNGLQDRIVTVAAGASSVTTTMHALSVGTTVHAQVMGTLNTVSRVVYITINP